MKSIDITPSMREWTAKVTDLHTRDREHFMGRDSPRNNKYLGHLAEAVYLFTHSPTEYVNAPGYDFVTGGQKIEVKGQWSQYPPFASGREYYLVVTITDAAKTDADALYCFYCVDPEKDRAWKLGYISNARFIDIRAFRKKGETQGGGNFRYTTDCWEITFTDLDPDISKIPDLWDDF